MPELSTTDQNPILTGLLTELAQVFTERDDFRDEVERLQEQYAEVSETAFARGQKIDSLASMLAERSVKMLDLEARLQDSTRDFQRVADYAKELEGKLDRVSHTFGEAFVHGETGPSRKNRHKLTPAQVGGIRSMVRNGSQRAYVARVYGVHPTTVSRIANGTYHRACGDSHGRDREGTE